jgi:uncharacterized protein YjbI with pentapeptide repeats
MKIIRPLTLGLLSKPYRYRGKHRLAVTAYGFFHLGGIAERRFLTENLQWPAILASLPVEQALDEVMPKRCGEVLVSGRAHSPDGQPVKEMAVRLACAGVDKTLRVVGDRSWSYGLIPWYQVSQPLPFTAMPLGYERAFGGPKHSGNPVGRGYSGNPLAGLIGANQGLLPNLEYPHSPIKRHWRRQPPAGFGPLDLRWTPRHGRGGDYDGAWLQEDFPGLARNIDWRIFNRAPEDQWLKGFFQGGEEYRLEGMHPTLPVIAGKLPNSRLRAFLQRQDGGKPLEEVELAWDSVWFFPEHLLGVAAWHGQAEIADSDALDIHVLMGAYEDAAEPRPLAHYRQVCQWRQDPATAAQHLFNEGQLAPARSAEEEQQLQQARQQAAAEQEQARQAQAAAVLEQVNAELLAAGLEAQTAAPLPPPLLTPPTPAEIASGDFDLSALFAQAQQVAEQAKAKADAARQDMAAQQAQLDELTPPPAASDAAAAAQAAWEQALDKASRPALDLVGGAADSDPDCRQLLDTWAAGSPPSTEQAAQRQQAIHDLLQAKAQQRQARRAAPQSTQPPLPATAAARLGQQIRTWVNAGICLAGRDLAGADLRGAKLSGIDLREAMLEGADLSDSDLANANLAGAVLSNAILRGTRFEGANLTDANLSHSQAAGASFKHADLSRAQAIKANWQGADLGEACLDGLLGVEAQLDRARLDAVRATGCLLPQATLAGCTAYGAKLKMLVALAADFSDADFSGAQLDSCVLLDAKLGGSRWSGARLDKVQGGGKADWSRADLSSASLNQCGCNGARFPAANFAGAQLLKCDFGNADLTAADLSGALLSGSLFYAANLSGCRAPGSDWFQALCRKSDFSGADLSHASLVQAELSEARFDRAQLQGVRLDANRSAA